jgi:hypothetical protein
MNFPTFEDFAMFVDLRYGRTSTMAMYNGADIMIGERRT